MRKIGALAIALAVLTTTAVQADIFFSGDTTGGPTFNRPSSLVALSGVGTATPYFVQPFFTTTNQSGVVFEVDGISHSDTFALIYTGSFDPLNALTNLVDGDDDFSGSFTVLSGTGQGFASSRIAAGEGTNFSAGTGISLVAGTQYFAVIGGFGNTDFGTFDAGIGGTDLFLGAIPEPSTGLAVGLIGLIGLAFGRRRRG